MTMGSIGTGIAGCTGSDTDSENDSTDDTITRSANNLHDDDWVDPYEDAVVPASGGLSCPVGVEGETPDAPPLGELDSMERDEIIHAVVAIEVVFLEERDDAPDLDYGVASPRGFRRLNGVVRMGMAGSTVHRGGEDGDYWVGHGDDRYAVYVLSSEGVFRAEVESDQLRAPIEEIDGTWWEIRC